MALDDIASTAEKIAGDIAKNAPFDPLGPDRIGDLDRAYAVQRAVVVDLLRRGSRTKVGGFKIAMNAPALMERFALSEPIGAHIFAEQVIQSPATLSLSDFVTFHYEPEIAAILKSPLPPRDPGYSEEEVKAAIDRFVPAFEVIDSRHAEIPKLDLVDAVSQNITNAGAIVGGPGVAPDALDADTIRTVVRETGETVLDQTGARPQSPLQAVTFIANLFGGMGIGLEAGMLILCGAHQPPKPITSPTRLEAEMGPLGSVELMLT